MIWACERHIIQETMVFPGGGFVRTKVNAANSYCWYASPSGIIILYEEILDSLVLDARDHNSKIIANDFKGVRKPSDKHMKPNPH